VGVVFERCLCLLTASTRQCGDTCDDDDGDDDIFILYT